jgi:DNA-binding transcriptional regulator YdaS (Cro superfamily)
MQEPVYIQALEQASVLKGGEAGLAEHLGVPVSAVRGWLRGLNPVPSEVFLKAVDVLYGEASRNDVSQGPRQAP